jgi:WD40 repeat protein
LNELEQAYVDGCVALRETQRVQEEAQRQRELEAARQLAAEAEARRQAEAQARQEAEQRAEEQAISTRSLRKWRRVLAVVALLAATAAVWAYLQQRKAEQQARIATSRQATLLALSARSQLDNHRLDLSLLLGLEAHNTAPANEARDILAAGLKYSPHRATLMSGHTHKISGIAFSPDGQILASGSEEGTIILWDAASGRRHGSPLFSLPASRLTAFPVRLTYSPDGQTLSATILNDIYLWDVAQLQQLRTPDKLCQVQATAFKKDGKTLIVACSYEGIKLVSVATGELLPLPLNTEWGSIRTAVFNLDGKTLATIGEHGILVWDVESGKRLTQFDIRDAVDLPLALSPNGQILAVGGKDGTIVLWDIAMQKPIAQQPHKDQHKGHIVSIAFSPDGQTLASGGSDSTIMLWDGTSGKSLGQPLNGHRGAVSSLVFSPKGSLLASGDETGWLMQWHVTRGQALSQPLLGHSDDYLSAVALSPDNQTLVIGSAYGLLTLVDVTRGQALGQPLTGYKGELLGVAFSSDNKVLAVGRENNAIAVHDVVSRQPVGRRITGYEGHQLIVRMSPDGHTLAVLGGDRTVKLWDVRTSQPRELSFPQSHGVAEKAAFSPDGKSFRMVTSGQAVFGWDVITLEPLGQQFAAEAGGRMLVSSDAKILAAVSGFSSDNPTVSDKLTVWDFSTGERLAELELGEARREFEINNGKAVVSSVALDPDGKTLALGGAQGLLILLDVPTGESDITAGKRLRHPLFEQKRDKSVLNVAFSPDGQTMASGSEDGTIILWDVRGYEPLGQIAGHEYPVLGLTFSQDGKTLVSHTRNFIGLWDVTTRQPLAQRMNLHLAGVSSVSFSPDGKTLASGSKDTTIVLWDVATGQPQRAPLTGHNNEVERLVFSPDGKTLASGSEDTTIVLWDVATGRPRRAPLTGHNEAVVSLAFSPDGKTLASGSMDETIILSDVAAGERRHAPLTGHNEAVVSLTFSPDGKTLASRGEQDGFIIWDITTQRRRDQMPSDYPKIVTDVIFSLDGKTFAVGGQVGEWESSWGAVIFGDSTTGQLLQQPLIGQSIHVLGVAFSLDGKTLLTIGEEDGRIMRWDVTVETWQHRVCRIANRNLTLEEWYAFIGSDTPYRRSCPDLPAGEDAPPAVATAPQ